MNSVGLTGRQAKLYEFIAECIDANRVAPTYSEMMQHLDCSRSNVAWLIDRLLERGYIVRLDRKARGIGLRRPDGEPPANLAEEVAKAEADGIWVRFPRNLSARLLSRCHENGAVPGELIAKAVFEYLGRQP